MCHILYKVYKNFKTLILKHLLEQKHLGAAAKHETIFNVSQRLRHKTYLMVACCLRVSKQPRWLLYLHVNRSSLRKSVKFDRNWLQSSPVCVTLLVYLISNLGTVAVVRYQDLQIFATLVRQLEADILTISRGNSILVLSCFFKISKYIFERRPRWNFLWALANTFFVNITIKLYYCKRWYFKFHLRINYLHHEKAHKKLNIRHLNGHLDFSSGFQVIDPSNYEKVLKSRKNTGH